MSIACTGLTCGYPDRAVLSEMNFSAEAGEAVALLGANGGGKSTLLKTLTGELAPIAGEVMVDNQNLESLSLANRAKKLAFVPQEEIAVFPFKVQDLVMMGRISRSSGLKDTPEDMESVISALQQAGCADLADRPVTELSGGEYQRVLIARALAQETNIVLLDEPTSHLDVSHQLNISEIFRQLRDAGKLLIVALHDLNLASTFASRVVLLHEGRIHLDLPTEEALNDHKLDEAYGVRFERVSVQNRTLLVPLAR